MSHTADCFLLLQWGRRTRVLEPTLGQIQTSRSCTTQVITGYGGSWRNGVVWRSMHGNVRWAYFLAFLSKFTKNTHGSVFYRIPETFLPLRPVTPETVVAEVGGNQRVRVDYRSQLMLMANAVFPRPKMAHSHANRQGQSWHAHLIFDCVGR